MPKLKVIKPFYDIKEDKDREAGDTFTVTAARQKELIANLKECGGGFVEVIAESKSQGK